MTYVPKRKDVITDFWSAAKTVDSGCWEWQRSKTLQGYGKFKRVKGQQLAHRAAWILVHERPLSKDICVCHTCDNPSCVNPNHLFLGTKLDNNRDRAAKGRSVTPNMNLTHCKRGHEFNESNTTIRKSGTRLCRICNNMKSKEGYHRRKTK